MQVLVEYKTKDSNHVEWARALKDLYLPGLRDYVKNYHTTGPAWNPSGVDVAQWNPGSADAPKKTSAPPPPPPKGPHPPPPPPGPLAPPSTTAGSSTGTPLSMSAVFQEINKGEAVTTGQCSLQAYLIYINSIFVLLVLWASAVGCK